MPTLCLASVVVVLFFAVATPAAQQGTSEIRGRVVDQTGAVLPGVTIVLTNEDTGGVRKATSGVDGRYVATQLSPGRYRLDAKLSGFKSLERRGLVLQLGATPTIDLVLQVGRTEEIVTVPSTTPLIDVAGTGVGGNIGPAELTGLPAMNRSFLATAATLPAIQITPTNQLGNDTIVASGQDSQNNNISVDGGYNTDNNAGTTFGVQVRTPLEAIQEVQVLTSMYGAEHGRAGGAIVNVVTRQGTNTVRGGAFAHAGGDRLTAKDFFAIEGNLPEPEVTKRDWGFVVGGPIVRNKAHFFFSLERQVDKPIRTRLFSARPSLNFSIAEDRTSWNTLIRFDHQISANHTWSIRWLRDDAPHHPIVGPRSTQETFGDETDRDQMVVGTLTSVLGNSRVNTFRVARTWEHSWQGNECFRAQGGNGHWTGFEFGKEAAGKQDLCPPQLNHLSFQAQASSEAQGRWDSNYQVEDHFSWFVPNRKGTHNLKVGARFNYTELRHVSQFNRNGIFRIRTDDPFDRDNPKTYPERLSIRIGAYDGTITSRTLELYAQDQWQMGARTTLNAGVRYDLEITPMDETENPLFRPGQKYPIDRNNIGPRVELTRQLDAAGKSLVRAGYGLFYNRTLLGTIHEAAASPKFSSSFVAQFPNDAVDPGPRDGRFPTDPFLVNGPFINKELLNQRFPPGTRQRNTGVVVFDSPNRKQPFAHQFSVGYVRALASVLAVHADYVRIANEQMFLSRNLNPMVRADTTPAGAITRVDAFGVLGEPYRQQVWVLENGGESVYDAINLQLEKRYADAWAARLSYSLSYSRGTAEGQNARNTAQVLTDLRLNERWGPAAVDRRHILSISGRTEIPKTGGVTLAAVVRYMSGVPFTMFDSSIDADRNGELNDPLPAGTYSGTGPNAMVDVANEGGRNGAYGPDYFQADVRAGWRLRIAKNTLEFVVDVYNITNRTNFANPGGDRLLTATFLVPTAGSGFPRQAQLGVRYTF
jgi:hypothetical protein